MLIHSDKLNMFVHKYFIQSTSQSLPSSLWVPTPSLTLVRTLEAAQDALHARRYSLPDHLCHIRRSKTLGQKMAIILEEHVCVYIAESGLLTLLSCSC